MGLKIVPLDLKRANFYVDQHHRHNGATNGHKFSIGVLNGDELAGVCICGKPVARFLDNGKTLEVRRVCTTGARNACSILYAAAARVAKELGYERIITYTLQSETGTSLRAAGWTLVCKAGGQSWNMPGRPREEKRRTLFGTEYKYPDPIEQPKYRWERILSKGGACG